MRRAVLLGFGVVGKCALPLLLDSRCFDPDQIVVIDKEDEPAAFTPYRSAGIRYVQREITQENLGAALATLAAGGDLLINLSASINCLAIADWCQSHGVMYIDTAFEPWGDNIFGEAQPPNERTMYWEHYVARRHAERHWRPRGPTALFGHGANPGLVSQFARAAVMDLARHMANGRDIPVPTQQSQWAALAQSLGVKVIHISERDTQVLSQPKEVDEFVNTWSVFSFIEESCRPVEIGWGTHEKTRPVGATDHELGPKHAFYIPMASSQLLLRSWLPACGPIDGLALPHSESITISRYFTLANGKEVHYRPTVAYSYLPCDAALASIHELRMNGWRMPERMRVVSEEVLDGADELGVLILGPEPTGWWYGSRLDIHQTRRLVQNSNPTALQVAAGVLAAVRWMKDNDDKGYQESEDLPYAEILGYAEPYLGTIISTPVDWNPCLDRRQLFGDANMMRDYDDVWQFKNFIAT
jgi:homospermidine synthase